MEQRTAVYLVIKDGNHRWSTDPAIAPRELETEPHRALIEHITAVTPVCVTEAVITPMIEEFFGLGDAEESVRRRSSHGSVTTRHRTLKLSLLGSPPHAPAHEVPIAPDLAGSPRIVEIRCIMGDETSTIRCETARLQEFADAWKSVRVRASFLEQADPSETIVHRLGKRQYEVRAWRADQAPADLLT
jgi:hypothetical protein